MQLPLVIAERPFDVTSPDYFFVQASTLMHKRLYDEALNILKTTLDQTLDLRHREMLLFNQAFCLFKIHPADLRAREIWGTLISERDVYFKTLA